jgi:hypothetical protein
VKLAQIVDERVVTDAARERLAHRERASHREVEDVDRAEGYELGRVEREGIVVRERGCALDGAEHEGRRQARLALLEQ